MPERTLVVMRLVEMWRTHPAQDNSRACATCGQKVGIYPSGQKALKRWPETRIVCSVCVAEERARPAVNTPAGPIKDILQEIRDSKDVAHE